MAPPWRRGYQERRNFMKKLLALSCVLLFALVLAGVSQAGDPSAREIEQRNMEIIRQAHANLAAGDFEAFKSVISSNYVRHCQAMPPGLQELHGTKEFFGFLEDWRKAVPNYTDTLSNMIADGDRVAYISTMTGTQTGPLPGIPATGKTFTVVNIIMQRLEDGKVVETWVSWDNVAFLTQLGLMPGPPEGAK
jgi:steroid delta-isomerase-like uncharacterized protein